MGIEWFGAWSLWCLLVGGVADGPQFVEVEGAVPGPVHWTEAVVPVDVNGDGRLDLLCVNCDGWARPGDMGAKSDQPLAPTLLINESKPGTLRFTDGTAKYLPADFKVFGKDAIAADVDGDGHADLVFACAFGHQQRLLRWDPAGGKYVDESERLGDLKLNAHGLRAGDLDDDGDLDLVFPDAGERSFRRPGGKARLLLNDGSGRFSDASARLNAVEKIGAQNPQIIDIDNDLDLDIVLDGKSAETHLYLNDGSANFTLDKTSIPKCEGRPYEVEWGDLDGDGDLDGIFMNFGGARRRKFENASLENHFADRGTLEFTASILAFDGENAQDENDFALLDADDDGDLDVIVGVLTGMPGPEKLFINQGRFGDGFLKQQVGAFSGVVDGSLDVDVADLDGDGRMDVVTVQGENRRGPTHENRVYRNTGPKDTRGPRIGRTTPLDGSISAQALAAGVPIRAWIQDASFDDGVSFVTARLAWRIESGSAGDGVVAQSATRAMRHVGGGIHRAVVKPSDQALVGSTLEVSILATDAAGNSTVARVWAAAIVE